MTPGLEPPLQTSAPQGGEDVLAPTYDLTGSSPLPGKPRQAFSSESGFLNLELSGPEAETSREQNLISIFYNGWITFLELLLTFKRHCLAHKGEIGFLKTVS
ncbi:hypothetical protein AVEN_203072-1 [Araneus ventricosus]|uniref:Uncharacterized protein n=1 Tax=Araneus ventricosus TaxID=182803 RepID=A0A4Y2UZ89_ARAVE|nr:hypothetical protein AVEN_203072-1 [Araneus ventricosus]